MVKCLLLAGYMGAGKSYTLRLLQRIYGPFFGGAPLSYFDLDDEVKNHDANGRAPLSIIQEDGPDAFRRLEEHTLIRLINERDSGSRSIIALGGGTLTASACEIISRRQEVEVRLIQASLEECWRRVQEDHQTKGPSLPLGRGRWEQFSELYQQRRSVYENIPLFEDIESVFLVKDSEPNDNKTSERGKGN